MVRGTCRANLLAVHLGSQEPTCIVLVWKQLACPIWLLGMTCADQSVKLPYTINTNFKMIPKQWADTEKEAESSKCYSADRHSDVAYWDLSHCANVLPFTAICNTQPPHTQQMLKDSKRSLAWYSSAQLKINNYAGVGWKLIITCRKSQTLWFSKEMYERKKCSCLK